MSVTRRHSSASPEEVFAVLSDADSYAHWVVGASETRFVEGNWPDEGATFHHTQGVPKIGLKDTTSVLVSEPPRYLKLRVRIRPFLIGEVELELTPSGTGTDIVMTEHPVGGLLKPVHNPLFDLGFHLRNVEGLRRLDNLACSSGPGG
jgi:uncharacterized protein YndB with AHSA1/START domain